jgi:hypothetical protein
MSILKCQPSRYNGPMHIDQVARAAALELLLPLVGEWSMETAFSEARGRTVFAWILDGQYLEQRAEIPHPDAPDGIMIIDHDAERDAFRQHYFDSRGVTRVYEMTIGQGVWKLWRDAPGFNQRFTGAFSQDGLTIHGAWEMSADGSTWAHDFDLTYRKVT